MVWPIVAVAAVTAGAQFLNSEEAKKASAKERKKIQQLLDQIQDPTFDTSRLTPEDYEVVQKYVPEMAVFVEEAKPELVKGQSAGAIAGRDAEMAALERLRNLSETGDDAQSRLLRAEALRDAQVQNQGQQGAIEQSFARRGVGGGTMELVSRLLGQQESNRNATQAAQQAAMNSYNQRLGALRDSASLGGQIRQSDLSMEELNTGRINDFNRRFAADRNTYNQNQANTLNEAQKYNIGNAQRAADMNTAQRNDAAQRYQDQTNRLAQQQYDNQMGRVAMQTGQYNANAQAARQDGQDRANQISGLGSMVMQGYGSYNEGQERQKDRDAYAKRYGG